MVDVARAEDLSDDVLDGVGGNREADPDVAGRGVARLDLRVHADDLTARVQERTAGVAVVDRRVGLDDVVDGEAIRGRDEALQGAHDARGRGAVEAEGIADRDDRVADFDASESPSGSGVSALAAVFTRSTAMSLDGSVPTTSALTVSRFEKLTVTMSAPSTTW